MATADKILLAAVGAPKNINTIKIDQLACVKAWAAADAAERVRAIDELARAFGKLRSTAAYADVRTAAWAIGPVFTKLVALGKAIDRLIRARANLGEETLAQLAAASAERREISSLRVIAQLEHHVASGRAIGWPLECAIAVLIDQLDYTPPAQQRLYALISPVVDSPVEPRLVAAIAGGDRASRVVYADWLEERGDRRGAAYVRDPNRVTARLVRPAWAASLAP